MQEKTLLLHIITRSFYVLTVLFCVSILSFALAQISSVDSAETIAHHLYGNPTPAQVEHVRREKQLDKPAAIQYFSWLKNACRGNLGVSYLTGNPVLRDIAARCTATGILVTAALLLIIISTIPLAVYSVYKRGSVFDHVMQGVSIIGISLPSFWLGFLLLSVFAVSLRVCKVVEYGTVRSVLLPAVTLAAPVICSSIRILRALLLEQAKQDYVFYARARGLSEQRILWKHILKNALPPMITLFFQDIGMMIGGSVIVESVFSWPGLGLYMIESIVQRDIPAVTGCLLLLGTIFTVSNALGETVNHLLSPHIFTGKEGSA